MREYGSEFYVEEPGKKIPDFLGSFTTIRFLSTGREALGLAADYIGPKGDVILLPAYSCDSMIQPFLKRGWKVFFYPIHENFSVNDTELIYLCKRYSPKAVLLMNFFGVAPTEVPALKIKSFSERIFIIEDFTHILFSPDVLLNKHIDFYAASIRKWLGIYDGAVLLSDKNYEQTRMTANSGFLKLRKEGQLLKLKYQVTKEKYLKENYLAKLKKAELLLENYSNIHSISNESYAILENLNIENIRFSRKSNFFHLYEIIKDTAGIELPVKPDDYPSAVPFSLPVLVDNRDSVQKHLSQKGLYAQVLWPINSDSRKICAFSAKMSDKMLSIPIDQRFDYDDIEDMGAIVKSVINDFS